MEASDTIARAIFERKKPDERIIVAIAGAPAAGKTTIASDLCDMLNQKSAGSAAILAMDGFHFDNSVLKARGILAKKGAPQTFDADGFTAALERVRAGNQNVAIPVFDRQMDLSRSGASVIDAAVEIIIVEGNYLLLEHSQWAQSALHYNLKIFIEVPLSILEERLIKRWISYGFDPVAAKERAQQNDLVNAKIVLQESQPADIVISPLNGYQSQEKEPLSASRMF
ncbi:MAG: nucleoside/nucleotide kinase family protein [Devosiaceae bacterium]|nr:nucleoside/nucleotide kinase family protein [Devosiaceae bacterium]